MTYNKLDKNLRSKYFNRINNKLLKAEIHKELFREEYKLVFGKHKSKFHESCKPFFKKIFSLIMREEFEKLQSRINKIEKLDNSNFKLKKVKELQESFNILKFLDTSINYEMFLKFESQEE